MIAAVFVIWVLSGDPTNWVRRDEYLSPQTCMNQAQVLNDWRTSGGIVKAVCLPNGELPK